jgi:hypothetical protein
MAMAAVPPFRNLPIDIRAGILIFDFDVITELGTGAEMF